MKLLIYLVFLFIFTISWSQDKADSSRNKLDAIGTISLNSNGIAYIPAFELKAGVVISAFFSEYEAPNEVIWQAQRYFAIEFTGLYTVATNSSLSLTYLYDRGQDPGTLIGHYINFGVDKSEIAIGKKGLLSTALQLFYLNYSGNNDGIFIYPKISFSVRTIPSSIYFQAIQALDSNITPFPGFKWNLGLSYTL